MAKRASANPDIDYIVERESRLKRGWVRLENEIDPLLLQVAGNGALVMYANNLLNKISESSTRMQNLTLAGYGLVAGSLGILVNREYLRFADKHKIKRPLLYGSLMNLGLGAASVAGYEAIKNNADGNAYLMLPVYAMLGAGIYYGNKLVISPVVDSWSKYGARGSLRNLAHKVGLLKRWDAAQERTRHENRSYSKGRTARLALEALGMAALGAYMGATATFQDFKYDLKKAWKSLPFTSRVEVIDDDAQRQPIPKSLESSMPENLRIHPELISKHDIRSKEGQAVRMARFEHIVRKVEDYYGIPRDLMMGLGMQEGRGNPIQTNLAGGPDFGLWQFVRGTAREYGLPIWYDDLGARNYGYRLQAKVKELNFNYEKICAIDKRACVPESTWAAGKLLYDKKSKYGSWEAAVSAFNNGHPAQNYMNTPHVKGVYFNKDYYREWRKRHLTAASFPQYAQSQPRR
jgi:hypothetical protein